MKVTDGFTEQMLEAAGITRHPNCRLEYDAMTGDYDCGFKSVLACEDCKYGFGTKDPEAKCNR